MARCEDYPCCGHELGCCPDYDESGRQLNMKCTCGATIPLNSPSSICDGCMRRSLIEDGDWDLAEDMGLIDGFGPDDEDYDGYDEGDEITGMDAGGFG